MPPNARYSRQSRPSLEPGRIAVHRGLIAALAALAFAAASACATLPPCPAKGGPAWTELTSEHLDLITDLPAAEAQEILHEFDEMRRAVLVAAWRRAPEPRGHLTVIVFASASERRVFMPRSYVGWLVTSPGLHQAFLMTSADERRSTMAHLLTWAMENHHGLLGRARWFDEGLARYLGPLTLEDDGQLTYGQVDPLLFRGVTRGWFMSFAKLWEPPTLEERGKFVAMSWLAVHYLFNHEPERTNEFQRRLIAGEDARAAWRDVFPDLTDEVMTERLGGYAFQQGAMSTFELRLPPLQNQATMSAVDDADVHGVRALLYATTAGLSDEQGRALARAEVTEALTLAPDQLLARFVQRFYLGDDVADLSIPVRLVVRYPDNVMSWAVLARAHHARHEDEEERRDWAQIQRLTGDLAPPRQLDLRVARPD